MTDVKLWYLIEGQTEHLDVDIPRSQNIGYLKRRIFAANALFFTQCRLDAARLTLMKVDADLNDDDVEDDISSGRYRPNADGRLLQAHKIISTVWPEPPPDNHLSVYVGLRDAQTVMFPITANISEFTMKLRDMECWDRLCKDDLYYSNVGQAGPSQFLQEFQERLGRKRYIGNAAKDVYEPFRSFVQSCSTLSLPSLDSYFGIIPPLTENNISKELDQVTATELIHYSSVLCNPQLKNRVNYDKKKEWLLYAFLLEFLAVQSQDVTCAFGLGDSGLGLRFHLVIEANDRKMRYTPHSDFHVCIRGFPHILLEVNSQPNEGDEFRMLLQAACVSRIGNWLRASPSNEPIVIMAIYIDRQFQAHQHILCQPDVGSIEVEYVTRIFDLTVPRTAFEFIFQMYNFFSLAQNDNVRLDRPSARLAEAKQLVVRQNYQTFSNARRTQGESQRESRKKPRRDPGTSTQGGEEDSFGNPSVQREITRAGYIPTQPIPDELTLLTPLKPTMRQATSQSGVLVILKTIADSNEHQLLHYFSGIKEPSNHTIPLLDIIELSIEKTIIVLPWKSPLDEVLRFRDRPDDVVSLCLQFIEGVAFLHQHNVAHCDLNPGNVVVDTKSESVVLPRLFIIDLDLALSVESEETMTEGWCGTPPWIAPELGSRNGPVQRYSPILADRWACGRMIEYFVKYFPAYEGAQRTRLGAFAQRLFDINPRARPELNELQAIRGPGKRKATTSQHESVPKRNAVDRAPSTT